MTTGNPSLRRPRWSVEKDIDVGQDATTAGSFNRSQRGPTVGISKDNIFKIACSYEGYSNASDPKLKAGAKVANSLDVTAYEISLETQKAFYLEEIDRLLSAVTEESSRRTFTGTRRLAYDTQGAYETMASLCSQMWTALDIITYDAELLLRSHCPDLHQEDRMLQSRQSLKYLTKNNDDNDDEGDENEKRETAFPSLDYEGSREDYLELVNYITEILCRVFWKVAYGKLWHENILACIAKISTKMKVLSAKLEDFASMSLSQTPARPKRSTAGVARTRGTGNLLIRRDEPSGKPDTMFQYLSALEPQDKAGKNRGSRRHELARLYWAETMKFQGPIQMILGRLLLSLRGVKRHKAASTTSYELCARLYQTGFHNFRALVFQDLNGEYSGSSKEENITISQSVFEVLNSAVNGIVKLKSGYQGQPDRRQSLGPSPDGPPQRVLADRSKISHRRGQFTTVGTFISWSYTSDVLSDEPQSKESKPSVIPITNDRPKSHDIRSLNETITVMVPLVMSNPIVIGMITEFVGLIVQTSQAISDNVEDQVEVAQGTKFTASFSLTTQGYVESWKKSRHSASSQLSKVPMGRDKLFSGNTSEGILKGPLALDLPTAIGHSERGHQMKEEQERHIKWERGIGDVKRRMNEWVFEETGVRVSCGLYVWSILTIATTLVAGGIASGLTIQERMPGVDPFNIATFSWVVAGFIILIAKSARVGDWSWRDFLQRQVLCRSVSELHHVTGIDSQLIIAKLLHDESSNRLRTRGPYNCVFTRRTDILEGFSIDRPVSVDTMLLSGLIMVQVQAPYYGEFLVCLDIRKGTAVHSIKRNFDPAEEKSYIASNTVPNFSLSQSESPRVSLCRGKPHWRQVIGIYGRRDCLSI